MMRETSLDEHNMDVSGDKSLSYGAASISMNHHRQASMSLNHQRQSTLQRDIGGGQQKVACRNPSFEQATRTNENLGRDEEEKKQDEEEEEETPAEAVPSKIEEGKNDNKSLKKSFAEAANRQIIPMPPQAQDYLRTVTTAGAKRQGTSWWERVVVQRSSYVVEDLVEQYTADSQFLQSDPFDVAWMDRIEVETGDLLGAGTYSNVYRVQGLELLSEFLTDHAQQSQLRKELLVHPKISSSDDSTATAATSTPTTTSGGTGYAIKHLKSELLQNSKLFEAAAADLIMEAKFLSRLSHPNILRLRGMALGGSSTFSTTGLFDSYFLVVDELEETLIQRIHRWRMEGSTDQYRNNMILYKLKLAVQVASALAYLHERRLIFRDLKPHNIGLKRDGTIQLFDFGFCRELPSPSSAAKGRRVLHKSGGETALPPEKPPSVESEDEEDKLYCMSGKGTLLYMAAEVLSSRCYNAKADVYSWSMVTYELLTLQKPFAVGSIEQHKKAVCERGQRPPLHHLRWLSSGVKQLLQHSWQANVQARWHMRDVKESLDDIITELESSKPSFSKEGSFGGATSPFFCQGVDMNDIILDITNTVQTRYEYITNQLFCQGSATDASSTNATAPDPSERDPIPADSPTKSNDPPKKEKNSITEEQTKEADKTASETSTADDIAAIEVCVGEEEQKDDKYSPLASFSMSMSTSLWGATSPHMPSTTSEQFQKSLCMHSVRLSAAKNRQVTAGPSSRSLMELRPDEHGSGRENRRASLSALGPTLENGSGGQTTRRSSLSSLGPTCETFDTASQGLLQTIKSEDKSMDTVASEGQGVLQTIKSEDDKSMDYVSLDGEAEESKPLDKEPISEQVDPGSESIHLPKADTLTEDTQCHTASEGSPQKALDQDVGGPTKKEDSAVSECLEKKKLERNPQDDLNSQPGDQLSQPGSQHDDQPGEFIPASASV